MNLSRDDWKKLALPAVICVALLAAGGTLIWGATQSQRSARVVLAAAQKDRTEKAERLARIAEEEREVREKLQVYEQLQRLNILGEERRL